MQGLNFKDHELSQKFLYRILNFLSMKCFHLLWQFVPLYQYYDFETPIEMVESSKLLIVASITSHSGRQWQIIFLQKLNKVINQGRHHYHFMCDRHISIKLIGMVAMVFSDERILGPCLPFGIYNFFMNSMLYAKTTM